MENGLKFETLLGSQQNTGLFLDMQPLRAWLKQIVLKKRCLIYLPTPARYPLLPWRVARNLLSMLILQKQALSGVKGIMT